MSAVDGANAGSQAAASPLRFLLLAAAAYFVLSLLWGAALPVDGGPDEPEHVEIVDFVAREGRFPVLGRDLGAHFMDRGTHRILAPAPIDPATGFRPIRVPPGTEVELRGHYCSMPGLPYLVPAAAARAAQIFGATSLLVPARAACALLGALTVLFTGLAAAEVARGRRAFVFLAAWSVATLPQFVFLGSYVNPDTGTVCAAAFLVWRLLAGARRGWSTTHAALFGVALGLAVLCKLTGVVVIALSCAAFVGTQSGPASRGVARAAWAAAAALLVAGPWLLYNHRLYGDPLGLGALGRDMHALLDSVSPADRAVMFSTGTTSAIAQGRTWADLLFGIWGATFVASAFGFFGWMRYPMAVWQYATIALLALAAVAGLARAGREAWRSSGRRLPARVPLVLLAAAALVVPAQLALALYQSVVGDFQAQGRYALPALPVLAIAFAAGWCAWPSPRFRHVPAIVAVLLALVVLAATPQAIR